MVLETTLPSEPFLTHHEQVRDEWAEELAQVMSCDDVDMLIELGCDLADAGREVDAERCFRRAAELGDVVAWFNLGNSLGKLGRWDEAIDAYTRAAEAGEDDAWLNLGNALCRTGDLVGAAEAYQAALAVGDERAAVAWAFALDIAGDRDGAEEVLRTAAAAGNPQAAGVLVSWEWDRTRDPALEPALRAGALHREEARSSLGVLLRNQGRTAEARSVLERGAKLGDRECLLPLGNLYADELDDVESAIEAYRAGIALGDDFCHHNLGLLLWDLDELDAAEVELSLGAAAGDALAVIALRDLRQERRGGPPESTDSD